MPARTPGFAASAALVVPAAPVLLIALAAMIAIAVLALLIAVVAVVAVKRAALSCFRHRPSLSVRNP
ncbi:hypothetical protein [Streptosporangium sp. NPDC002524]|uniref:hypothetical protein n=1 Tax=Streptosporangium sp. NPDC002524 TaxID=3154537 RepID=UPI0033337677